MFIGGEHPNETNHTTSQSMDFKLPEKYSYFANPGEKETFKYYEVKTKYQELFETVSEIAMKSVGTEDDDRMRASETFDGNLWGLGGNDILTGDDRNNIIYGGNEQDGREGEHITGTNGYSDNDTIHGGVGNDRLYGQSGNDWLTAGEGDDYLYGGHDNDVLIGNGNGHNIFNGGRGVDSIYLATHDNHAPDEIWDFVDEGDRIFLSDDFMAQTGGIASVETTLWNGNAQLPHREARNFGDFYQSTQIKNAEGEILFLVEGPTLDGITIGWNASGLEVIDTNGDWDGAKFKHMDQLTGTSQWLQENFV